MIVDIEVIPEVAPLTQRMESPSKKNPLIVRRQEPQLRHVIILQKWVRGHLARVQGKRDREVNFKYMRKMRRMLSVAYGRLRTKKLKQL